MSYTGSVLYCVEIEDGGVLVSFVEGSIKDLLGIAPGELAGDIKSWTGRLHPDDASRIGGQIRSGEYQEEYRIKDGSGEYLRVNDRRVVIKSGGGGLSAVGCLREADDSADGRYESILSNIPGVAYRCLLDDDWTMLYITGNIERLSGYPPDDFLNNAVRSFGSIIHPDDSAYVKHSIKRAISADVPWEIEYRISHRAGIERWVREKGRGVKGENGKISWLDGIILDITKLKRLQKKHRETEERLAATLRSIGDGVISTDSEGDVTGMNTAAELLTGYASREASGRPIGEVFRIFKTGTLEPADNPVGAALKEGRAVNLSDGTSLISRDGRERQIADSCAPIRDSSGEIIGAVLVFRDVSLQHRARIKEEFEMRFQRTVADVSARFVNLYDEEFDPAVNNTLAYLGLLFKVDRSYLFRFSPDLAAMDNTHEWCAEGIEPHMDRIQNYPAARLPWFKEQIQRLQPVHIPDVNALPEGAEAEKAEFSVQGIRSMLCLPFRSRAGALSGFLGFDTVSEKREWPENHIFILQVVAEIISGAISRMQVYRELRESEERFHDLARQAGIMVWEIDAKGLYTYVSDASESLVGYKPEELVGKKHFYDLLPDGKKKAFEKAVMEAMEKREKLYNERNSMLRKDGSIVDVVSSGVPLTAPDGALAGYRGSDIRASGMDLRAENGNL